MTLLCSLLTFMSVLLTWPLKDSRNYSGSLQHHISEFLVNSLRKRVNRFDEQAAISRFMLLCTAHLQSGLHLATALELSLQDMPTTFLPATRAALRHHTSISAALDLDIHNDKLENLELLAVGAKISEETGMSLVQMLKGVQANIERKSALTQILNQEIASTKATVVLLAALPIVGILLAMLLGADAAQWLISTKIGHVCAAVGIVCEFSGLMWIHWLIKKAVPK